MKTTLELWKSWRVGITPVEFVAAPALRSRAGFTRGELVAVLASVAVLMGIFWPALAFVKNQDENVVDLENGRRIARATQLYAADNSEFLPHTSWGLSGSADSWAFALENRGRIPGAPARIPDAAGENNAWFSPGSRSAQQLDFFRAGQLAKYETNPFSLICPKDYREVQDPSTGKLQPWLGRAQRVTSYSWNACLIDMGALPSGVTRKISEFRPADIYFWEAPEQESFAFNDAANQASEGVSQRHGGRQWARSILNEDWGGYSPVGTLGGSAEFVTWRRFTSMADVSGRPSGISLIPRESVDNYLWIGPQFGK